MLLHCTAPNCQVATRNAGATVLQPKGGPLPYVTAADGLQQSLACLHADLFVALFRAELRLGIQRSEAAAAREFDSVRASQLKRRQQRHIYGPQSVADKKREELEDEARPREVQHAQPTEARLLAEFAHDPYAKALLLLELAHPSLRNEPRIA